MRELFDEDLSERRDDLVAKNTDRHLRTEQAADLRDESLGGRRQVADLGVRKLGVDLRGTR